MKIKYISLVSILLFTNSSARPLINLTDAKNKVKQYYECGAYNRDMDRRIKRAIRHFKKVPVRDNAVVIFDIDETALSGYPDFKSISFGYIPKLSHKWILESDAHAIAQTKQLYDYLVDRGFRIIFMTGRKYNEYDATIKNLKEVGYTTFDKLIVRQPDELQLTARAYKTAHRKKLEKEGYNIVGSVGDQESDLKGGHSGYQVKLPNYIYKIE